VNPEAEEAGASGGLSATARRIAARVLQFGATRFELLAFEFNEERRSLLVLLGFLTGAALGAVFSLALLTLAVLLALPPAGRAWGAAVAAVAYGAVAGWLWTRARRLLRERPSPFSGTVAELKRDRAWIETLK